MKHHITDYLKSHDPVLAPLIEKFPEISLQPSQNYFLDLINSIVGQQLSMKAGDTIWARFTVLFQGKPITPESVSQKTTDELRTSGVSNSKARYIKNVADAFLQHTVTPEKFSGMGDEDIIAELIQIKGVGRWTAEMFCIFSLGREDIFSLGDLGLSRALANLYGKKKLYAKRTMKRMGQKWAPFRSYASLLLWKSLEK